MRNLRLLVAISFVTFLATHLHSQGQAPIVVAVFGPEVFTRGGGSPSIESRSFRLPALVKPPYTVEVINGDAAGGTRVSSARIMLNGTALFGPPDFNQRVAVLQRQVSLQDTNLLSVELRSAPGSSLAIRIRGQVESDVVVSSVEFQDDGAGGSVTLPGTAVLTVPPGALSGSVSVSEVDSRFMANLADLGGYLAPGTGTRLLAGAPVIRIKSSVRFVKDVHLTVTIPGLENLIPEGSTITFLALSRIEGDDVDELTPIGGDSCGPDAACVTVSPSWFLAINPADPLDPVLQLAPAIVSAGDQSGPLRLSASNLQPPGSTTIAAANGVAFNARVRLETDGYFDPPMDHSPVECPPRKAEFEGDLRSNRIVAGSASLCLTGTFYDWRAPEGMTQKQWVRHRALDFRTISHIGDPAGEQAVFNAGVGEVIRVEPGSGTGNWVQMQHDPGRPGCFRGACGHVGLSTEFMHLKPLSIQPANGDVLSHRQRIATSGRTPAVAPHLHFASWWKGRPIDPEPLLRRDLSLFFVNTPFNELPAYTFTFRRSVPAPDADGKTVVDFGVDAANIVSGGQDVAAALSAEDIAELCNGAAPCSIAAKLSLRAARLGGERVLAKWQLAVEAENHDPVIGSLAAAPSSVAIGAQSTVSVVASDINGDALEYNWASTCGTLSATSGSGPKTWTAPGAPGTCTVTVTVVDPSGRSDTESIAITVMGNQPPPIPSNFRASTSSTSSVLVSWDDTANETSYRLGWGPSFIASTITLPANTTSHLFTGLGSGISYHFTIRACNASGCSAAHPVIGCTPGAC